MFLYYNYSKVFSFNKHSIVIVGDRGHGKTYGIKNIGIKYGIKIHGLGMVYIRRYVVDLIKVKKEFLSDWIVNNSKLLEDYYIYSEGDYIWAEAKKGNDKFPIVEFIALSSYEKQKSIPRPLVKYMVFDEFITSGQYLKDECFAISDLKESIFRDRSTWVIVYLSNSLTTCNPILEGFGITPYDFQKEFTIRDNFVLHYDSYDEEWKKHKREVSPPIFGKYDYERYSVDSSFVLDDSTGVGEPLQGSIRKFRYNVKLEDTLIGVWEVNGLIYFGESIPTNQGSKTYSPIASECFSKGYVYMDYKNLWWKHTMENYVNGKLMFKTLKIKNSLIEVFNLIKRGF